VLVRPLLDHAMCVNPTSLGVKRPPLPPSTSTNTSSRVTIAILCPHTAASVPPLRPVLGDPRHTTRNVALTCQWLKNSVRRGRQAPLGPASADLIKICGGSDNFICASRCLCPITAPRYCGASSQIISYPRRDCYRVIDAQGMERSGWGVGLPRCRLGVNKRW